MRGSNRPDFLVIGGGFYGCCLALFLRSLSESVVLVEATDGLLGRASRVNQARVHTGFHYPRSALTAVRSLVLQDRFVKDFPQAVNADFQMLYAIAARRSKVSAKRFYRMFRDLGAPIAPASASQAALFDARLIEDVFACREVAFDHAVLRGLMAERLQAAGVTLRLSTRVTGLADGAEAVTAELSDGSTIRARHAFNVTYAHINALMAKAGLPEAHLKHEITELALIEPPDALKSVGVTVMDGPFFSCMPYPAEGLHSLTHVRYTPHESWIDSARVAPDDRLAQGPRPSRSRHMILDGQRYLPSLAEARYRHSHYEVKTVLLKNERDDGRPILFQRGPNGSRIFSVLGAKIDNIYDLFALVRQSGPVFSHAHDGFVMGRGT